MRYPIDLDALAHAQLSRVLQAVETPLSRQGMRIQAPTESAASSAALMTASPNGTAVLASQNPIQANYGPAIIVAAILGFLLGYLFGKRKRSNKSVKGGHG